MQMRKTHIATIVVGIAVVFGAVASIMQNQGEEANVSADQPVGSARLSIANQSLKAGQTADLPIILQTNQEVTSGIDIALAYNTNVLEIVDADPAVEGIQIAATDVFDFVQVNRVDPAKGIIRFSAGQRPTSELVEAAEQTVATIKVRAKAAGSSVMNFDFVAGALDDTNVIKAGDGLDLLSSVGEGTITVAQ